MSLYKTLKCKLAKCLLSNIPCPPCFFFFLLSRITVPRRHSTSQTRIRGNTSSSLSRCSTAVEKTSESSTAKELKSFLNHLRRNSHSRMLIVSPCLGSLNGLFIYFSIYFVCLGGVHIVTKNAGCKTSLASLNSLFIYFSIYFFVWGCVHIVTKNADCKTSLASLNSLFIYFFIYFFVWGCVHIVTNNADCKTSLASLNSLFIYLFIYIFVGGGGGECSHCDQELFLNVKFITRNDFSELHANAYLGSNYIFEQITYKTFIYFYKPSVINRVCPEKSVTLTIS